MTLLQPPRSYKKKIINPGGDCPLSAAFSLEQVEKKIAFYEKLNRQREEITGQGNQRMSGPAAYRSSAGFGSGRGYSSGSPEPVPNGFRTLKKQLLLLGWEDTTTVRVYMRETVMKIIENLFFSDYELDVRNVKTDKDHGRVEIICTAADREFDALGKYIYPGASYYVYDGEESKYVPGDTAASEFIITRPVDPLQPENFWRRSQSFIAGIVERAVV